MGTKMPYYYLVDTIKTKYKEEAIDIFMRNNTIAIDDCFIEEPSCLCPIKNSKWNFYVIVNDVD